AHDPQTIERIRARNGIADLKGVGDVGARAIVDGALHDSEEEARNDAAWLVSRFVDSGPVMATELEAAAASGDSKLRGRAAFPLGHLAAVSDRALHPLRRRAREPEARVREGAGKGLTQVRRVWPGQVPLLVAEFTHADPKLRYDVGDAVIPAGVVAVPPMLARLASPDWNERANAARVLGQIGETDGAVAAGPGAPPGRPDLRVPPARGRPVAALATRAAHDALRRRDNAPETYGPVRKELTMNSFAEQPGTRILVVAATYREFRAPLERKEFATEPPDLRVTEEHRLYWCDFE